jgi:3-deoxy-D-manno-octulosonate 8-phosphate phosphatase (KDO 8-P phosphatase)
MDVDGTLTRGDITYSELGDEIKTFNILDGFGIAVCRHAGLTTAIVTGRTSQAVERRSRELRVNVVCQKCRDKGAALRRLREEQGLEREEIAFVGDDINDILAFRESGFRFAVRNACVDLASQADYITERSGGDGAVREVIELILRSQGKWDAAVESFLRSLEQPG